MQNKFRGYVNDWVCFYCPLLFFLLCFVTAIFSHGWSHPDEFFQIIDYASYKLGNTPLPSLAWEFPFKMRPGIQPLIAYVFIKSAYFFHIKSPFIIAALLRICSGILGFGAVLFWLKITENEFREREHKRIYYFISCLLWFTPYLVTRFTSENWGGALFLYGLSFLLFQKKQIHFRAFYLIVAGLLMGLAFQCRYQIALLIAGICIHECAFETNRWKTLSLLGVGFILSLMIGALCDHWLYNQWVFPPLNYFRENILHHAAERFGIMPAHYYLSELSREAFPVMALFLFIGTLLALFVEPKNRVVWAIVLFILVHQVTPHKELRFLFPLIYLLPYVITKSIASFSNYKAIRHEKLKSFLMIFFIPFFLLNIVGAASNSIKATNARFEVMKYLYDNYADKPIQIICTPKSNPWLPPMCPVEHFYHVMQNMTETEIFNIDQLKDTLFLSDRKVLFICNLSDIIENKTQEDMLSRKGFTKKMIGVNKLYLKLNHVCCKKDQYRWFDNNKVQVVYELNCPLINK